jgi:hypothetical protein
MLFMNTPLIFFFAGIVILAFIIAKIIDPRSDKRISKKDFLETVNIDSEANFGAVLLRVGPIVAGIGAFGFLMDNLWNQLETRLIGIIIALLATLIPGLILNIYYSHNKNKLLIGEGLLLISSFLFGATLWTINQLAYSYTGSYLLGGGEFLGIWFLTLLPIAYLTRSIWIMSIATFVNIIWTVLYLSNRIDFTAIFNINPAFITLNNYAFLVLPSISAIILILLYNWHQINGHHNGQKGYRSFMYLTGMMAFFTVGALIFRAIDDNFIKLGQDTATGFNQLAFLASLGTAVISLLFFAVDYVMKKTVTGYSIHLLAAVAVALATISSLFFVGQSNAFLGFYFLEVAFVVWLLADWVRHNSQIGKILFYGINTIQILVIATSGASFDWFKLAVILAILIYACIVHYYRRGLLYYTMIIGMLSVIIKLLNQQRFDGYLILLVIGLTLMAFGYLFTQTKAKIIADKSLTK